MAFDHHLAYLLHTACVTVSLSWFLLRLWWTRRADPRLDHRLHRTGPHVIDTLLLTSGVYLAVLLHQYPPVAGWLTAKLSALLVYIISGSYALKRARTPRTRTCAIVLSLLSAAYILLVALTRKPFILT